MFLKNSEAGWVLFITFQGRESQIVKPFMGMALENRDLRLGTWNGMRDHGREQG